MVKSAPRSGPSILLVWDCYQLGDVLQRCSAVAAALRSVFPRATIDLATRAATAPLLRTDPNLRDVLELDSTLLLHGEKVIALTGELPRRKYDAMINSGGSGTAEVGTLKA